MGIFPGCEPEAGGKRKCCTGTGKHPKGEVSRQGKGEEKSFAISRRFGSFSRRTEAAAERE
ncbi:MAG: hypothetical protein E7487_01410 [Ruminococcaceae bacterium]|nr:hypothetical protein [Oscillospiraceae bacterium]